jgi:hypothetical protein
MKKNPYFCQFFLLFIQFVVSDLASGSTTVLTNAHFTVTQTYSSAPNFQFGNPYWLSYVQNMRASAATGFTSSAGDPTLPSYFEVASSTNPISNAIVTDATGPGLYVSTGARLFNSWHGQANPGTVFGSAFANQYGNHLFSPYVIVAQDTNVPFTLSSVVRSSFSVARNGGATPYSTHTFNNFTDTRIGITSFGLDGVIGGGDDVFINNGSALSSSPIIAFIAVGSGFGFQMSQQYDGSAWPGSVLDSEIFSLYQQQWGDGNASYVYDIRQQYAINYTVGGNAFSQTTSAVNVLGIPEPSTLSILCLTSLMLTTRRRASR